MSQRCAAKGELLVLLMMAAIAGCAGSRTQQSTGEYVDDSAITAKVKTAVLQDPGGFA